MSGTHVGIICNVTTPGRALSGEIMRVMSELSSRGPFRPLVLHHGEGGGANEVARNYARTLPDWRVNGRAEHGAEIAAACHILIVIAPGEETALASQHAATWSLVHKARASGRTIVHLPVTVPAAESVAPRRAAAKLKSKASQPSAASLAWARSEGTRDMLARKAIPKYTRFRVAHGLPDSPESLQLWQAYKRAAGVVPKKPKVKVVIPEQRPSAKKKVRTRKVTIKGAPPVRSRPDPTGAVPLTPHIAELMRKVNPPDPDVWR